MEFVSPTSPIFAPTWTSRMGDPPDGPIRPNLQCSPPVDPRDGDPLLRIERLTKRYPAVTAVDDLTVEVPRGRIGLVGANGAGKTTMFRMMLGLAHPTEGSVEVCGIDVADDPIGVRSRLGYMPEHDCLPLDQTAADVVVTFGELSGLPARAARQRASDVLDLVGLDEARFRPIGGFSTGMRQRTKLAQALVGDPELVLLDEPTAGLDPLGREEMLALVGRLGTFGISVLLATHLLDDVQQVCDHVVMLDGGRLVVSGPTGLAARAHRRPHRRRRHRRRRARRRSRRRLAAGRRRGRPRRGHDRAASHDLDLLRDVIADLGLPLYRLTSRLTSLDDVFLDTRGPSREHEWLGAVYDRGYRPYEGARGGREAATFALFQASMRRALGHPALVAAEGGPVRAARHRHDPGHRQRRGRLRHPQRDRSTASRSSPTASTSACRPRCCSSSPSSRPTSCARIAVSTCCR